MMDDAWYSTFVPPSQPQDEKAKHRRRATLLQQPHDTARADAIVEATKDTADGQTRLAGPPLASIARRAQSYSDFHNAVIAHGRKEQRLTRKKSFERETQPTSTLRDAFEYTAWHHDLEDELLNASHEEYQLYHEQLLLSEAHLGAVLQSTNSTLEILSSLSESFKAVEAQTSAFQAQCQNLLSEQKNITRLADDLKENVQYYAYLEPMTRRLNAPGAGNLVRGKEFPDMLSNLDSCLDYMQGHPNHREAPVYRSRYRLLLTRALTLVRVHFTNSLRELAADVSQRIADRQLNDTTQSALLYAKFRVRAPELKEMGLEIQKRAVLPADAEQNAEPEYQGLMNELYQSYSATRGRLILPIVAKKMTEIAAVDESVRDVVSFARSAIGFVRGICLDEYDLWADWFVGDGGVYEFLEGICEPLYDHLRPRTIHETKIQKLCELCTFIQTRYMENDDDEDDVSLDKYGPRALNFAALIQPALQDAQTRLVFLALAVLRDEIENFKPTAEDLEYPRKRSRASSTSVNGKHPVLSGRKTSVKSPPQTPMPKTPTIVDADDGGAMFDSQWAMETDKQSGASYPTLAKAVRLLSRIYRLVNSSVFDDLAHNIVHSTTLSLVSASSQITSRASATDGRLFLISHLLRLKQQIVAFDIEFVTPEVGFDFSSVTNTFHELRDRGGLWNPASWVRLAAGGLMPRVVENMLDAKSELDGRLRAVINDLVSGFAMRITAPLNETANGKSGGKGTGTGLDARRATTAVRGLTEKEVPVLRRKLAEYIEDVRTRETLVAAVRDQVILAYEEWIDKERESNGKGVVGKVSRKGKGKEDEIWAAEVFAEWCEKTFGVGSVLQDEDENEDAEEQDSR